MNEILKEELPRLKEIDFSISAPQAKEVFIAGDFNGWKIDSSSRMEHDNNGTWSKKLSLTLGRYRYRFVVDGEWIEDANNPLKEVNPFGSVDSLLEITAKK